MSLNRTITKATLVLSCERLQYNYTRVTTDHTFPLKTGLSRFLSNTFEYFYTRVYVFRRRWRNRSVFFYFPNIIVKSKLDRHFELNNHTCGYSTVAINNCHYSYTGGKHEWDKQKKTDSAKIVGKTRLSILCLFSDTIEHRICYATLSHSRCRYIVIYYFHVFNINTIR